MSNVRGVKSFSLHTVYRSASCQWFNRYLDHRRCDEKKKKKKQHLSVIVKSFSIKGSILSSYRGQTCLLRLKLLSAQHVPKDPWRVGGLASIYNCGVKRKDIFRVD